jgi:formylglycine-generating enzyme required for sulfatase activity
MSRRLIEDFALTDEAAQWAAESWAIALGVVTAEAIQGMAAESASATPPATDAGCVVASNGRIPDGDDPSRLLRHVSTANSVVNPADGAVMLRIPSGEFLMGDDDQKDNPRRRVFLDAYWMYKSLVTVAQYMKFCEATGRAPAPAPCWGRPSDHPVVNVSWIDAEAYAAWAGVTLPTETQWERAARGADGRLYPWGSMWDASRCVSSVGTPRASTAACGSAVGGASVYGVLDLAGNVWEWCSDWFDDCYLSSAPLRNPEGPPSGVRRVLRGASWNDNQRLVFRTSVRFRHDPLDRSISIGFRCAAPLER